MAVHNLQAENLTVTKWHSMDSFPKDGSIVEVEVDTDVLSNAVTRAQWQNGRLMVEGGPNFVVRQVHRWRPID